MKDPAAWPSGKMVKFGDRNVKLVAWQNNFSMGFSNGQLWFSCIATDRSELDLMVYFFFVSKKLSQVADEID